MPGTSRRHRTANPRRPLEWVGPPSCGRPPKQSPQALPSPPALTCEGARRARRSGSGRARPGTAAAPPAPSGSTAARPGGQPTPTQTHAMRIALQHGLGHASERADSDPDSATPRPFLARRFRPAVLRACFHPRTRSTTIRVIAACASEPRAGPGVAGRWRRSRPGG